MSTDTESVGPIIFGQGTNLDSSIVQLPLEIWGHILQRVPWHSREPTTRVCRAFCWLAQPLLFENLEIKALQDNQENLLEVLAFATSARIAPSVKVYRICITTLFLPVKNQLKEAAINALTKFQNLISLRLDGFTIDNSLVEKIAGLQYLVELEFLRCVPDTKSTIAPHNISLPYLRAVGVPIGNDSLDAVSASLVHSKHTHTVVLGHRPSKFLQGLVTRDATFRLRSLNVLPTIADSLDFKRVLDICPAIEELRFSVERINLYYPPVTTYPFLIPSESALSRLRVFQGPWYMVDSYTKGRSASHLVIWDVNENAFSMISSLSLRHPIESLELYVGLTSVLSALPSITSIKALSLVIECDQTWTDIRSMLKNIEISPGLEYFACYTSTKREKGETIRDLFPQKQFSQLRYIYDGECYDPVTGNVTEEDSIKDWQRRALGLYKPLIDCYI